MTTMTLRETAAKCCKKVYIGAAVLGILYLISDKNTKHSLGPRASGQQNAALERLEHRIQATGRLEHA